MEYKVVSMEYKVKMPTGGNQVFHNDAVPSYGFDVFFSILEIFVLPVGGMLYIEKCPIGASCR